MERNAYQILGLEPTASHDEIKKRYEELVQTLDNAKGGPGSKRRAEVVEAATVLADPAARAQYDLRLARELISGAGKVRRRKTLAAYIVGGAIAISSLAAGGWHAWDRGVIPGNSRALNLAVVEPVARRLVLVALLQRPIICAAPDLSSPAPEVKGLPGIESALAPGLFSVTLAKELTIAKPARDRQLQQLEFLAQQGYFSARDTVVQTQSGEAPAREYRLTWEGYTQLAPGGSDARPCFVAGRHDFVSVTSIKDEKTQIGGFDVYNVAVATRIVDAPKWASLNETKQVFPGYAESLKPAISEVRLVRGNERWQSAQEMLAQINLIQSGQAQMINQYARMMAFTLPPPLSAAIVKELLDGHLKTESGMRRMETLCIPLNLSGAGDDLEAGKRGVRNVFTYQDKSDRPVYSLKELARRITILEALTLTGFAVRENGAGPMPVAGEPAPSLPVQAKGARGVRTPAGHAPAWVRYRIDPGSADVLGMGRNGTGCIPLGTAKTQYLGFLPSVNMGGVAMLKATFESPPELTGRLAEPIRAVKFALTEGIALTAQAQYQRPNTGMDKPDGESGQWKVSYVSPITPQVKAPDLPAQWLAMMPLTAAIVVNGANSTVGVPVTTSVVPPAPPIAPPPSSTPQHRMNAPASTALGKLSIHVISIYEAELGGGTIPQGRREGIVNIKVESSDKPLWLVIDSYEPVHWIVNVAPESRLHRITASGYHPQRVTVVGATGVAVEVSGDGPRYKEEDSRQSAAAWVENKFKIPPESVQVTRKASAFVVAPKADTSSKL